MKQAQTLLIGATLLGSALAAGAGLAQTAPAETQPPPSQTQTQDQDDDDRQDVGEQNPSQQEETEQEGGIGDGEEKGDSGELNEAEEADDAPDGGVPAALSGSALSGYGKVSLQDAVSAAQAELGTRNAPFEATLERVGGVLTWALDFINPPAQVVLDANSGAVVGRHALETVPDADADLTSYGQLSLAAAVGAAQKAHGNPAAVTEVALEKDPHNGNVLTWRVDIGGTLVVLDAGSGQVLATGPLN